MPDNSFTIGATVDIAELQAGMKASADTVQDSLNKMMVSFQEASPAAARAVARISDDTRAAAANVDASWQRMAKASLAYSSSLKEVSAATYLARKSSQDDASALNLLAAAKQKAALASKELAAAQASSTGETLAEQALNAVKLRLANIPGLGNFGSLLALRAYEPIGKMLEESAGGLEEKFGGAALAVGGLTAGLVALGAVGLTVTHHMMDLAQSIENTAAATGLSTTQVQVYTELAKEMNVDAGEIETAFSRIQTQLGEYIATGNAAGSGSQYLIRIMKEMGISLTDVHGKLRPVNDILGDFYNELAKIPDEGERTAIEMAALGTRGRVVAQMFDEARRQGISFGDLLKKIGETGPVFTEGQLANLEQEKDMWDSLTRSVGGYMRQLGARVAFATTHPMKAFLASEGLVDLDAESKIPPAGAGKAPGATDFANVKAIADADAENQKLTERLNILRAGGEEQLKLKKAEEDHAAAVKSGNTKLAEQYANEVSQLKAIIALEAAKKEKHGAAAPDASAKAQLALELKQEQDFLTVWKAGAAQRAEVDKEEYEKGTLGLKAYFDRRRTEIQEETAKEIAGLKQERGQVAAAAELSYQQAGQTKIAAATAATPQVKAQLDSEADRQMAEHLSQLGRVDELTARIDAMQIESSTKITALNADQFKEQSEAQNKILAFQKEIDDLQGKEAAGDQAAIRLKTEEMTVLREKLKDNAEAVAQIDRQIAQYTQLKTAADEFSSAEKSIQQELRNLEIQRADIEIRMKEGKISERESERELTQLLAREIPLLREKAELELKAAIATGDKQRIQEAQQEIQEIQKINDEIKQQGTLWQQLQRQWNQAGAEVKTSLTGDFKNLFLELASGTKSAGQAFAQFGLSVLRSLEEIVAQMLATIAVQELMNALGFGASTSQLAKTVATNDAMITSNAGAAGAAAFASVMEAIPFPANIALAPATMATAIATTLSNLALGSAAGGAFLSEDTVLQAHRNEMVLPAPLSLGFKNIIGQMGAQGGAGGSGGSVSHHYDNRKYSPQITVHQTGSKMGVEEISSAVRKGMRLGY